jgi:hypothetical protein
MQDYMCTLHERFFKQAIKPDAKNSSMDELFRTGDGGRWH